MVKSNPWISKKLAAEILRECKIQNPSSSECEFIQELLSHVVSNPFCAEADQLSERERTCLFWIKQGKSTEEIASLMHVKQCTVKQYRGSIKAKLQCKTLAQALFKAMHYKPIDHLLINHFMGDYK